MEGFRNIDFCTLCIDEFKRNPKLCKGMLIDWFGNSFFEYTYNVYNIRIELSFGSYSYRTRIYIFSKTHIAEFSATTIFYDVFSKKTIKQLLQKTIDTKLNNVNEQAKKTLFTVVNNFPTDLLEWINKNQYNIRKAYGL